ncbi:MAG TPA: tripartite tricarboxylate transporter substrate binding protein [Burkholderiales bacterium]|nr:tripartite tricarboxylate transporter substrate binding protein [Burkholderiales bacterium]
MSSESKCSRRRLCVIALLATACGGAPAQNYPVAPVRMVVPFPVGGGVDSAGRLLAQKLSESYGRSFVVENRGGANGNIGSEVVAKSAKDGHTLLLTGAGLVTNPSLYARTPYDAVKDFDPISLMALGPNVLVAHPSLPVRSVKDLIALAKAKPGQIGFAGSGSGSTPHLAGELFNTLAGVSMVHVPYRGTGPAMIGVLGGETPVMFLPAISAVPQIKSGRLRALAVTSLSRLPAMPELPTVAEAGLRGYESSQWYGLLAPAGTPDDILNSLNTHVVNIVQAADVKQRLSDDGLVPVGNSREQFAAYIKSELVKWAKVIKQSGARID